MRIYLLRHGSAQQSAPRDRDRQISAAGREELGQVFNQCAEALEGVQIALVSPYVRAQQTFQEALPWLPNLTASQPQTLDMLAPDGNPLRVIEHLEALTESPVLVVSHQPLIGVLLDELCGFETGRYRMGTGAIAAIDTAVVARGLGELAWLKHP